MWSVHRVTGLTISLTAQFLHNFCSDFLVDFFSLLPTSGHKVNGVIFTFMASYKHLRSHEMTERSCLAYAFLSKGHKCFLEMCRWCFIIYYFEQLIIMMGILFSIHLQERRFVFPLKRTHSYIWMNSASVSKEKDNELLYLPYAHNFFWPLNIAQ